jgi:hypothetical protein
MQQQIKYKTKNEFQKAQGVFLHTSSSNYGWKAGVTALLLYSSDGNSWRSVKGLMTRSRGDSHISLGGLACQTIHVSLVMDPPIGALPIPNPSSSRIKHEGTI